MAQDIKKRLREDGEITQYVLPEGHKGRFEARLDKALHKPHSKSFGWMKIAASIAVIISAGYFLYQAFVPGAEDSIYPVTATSQAGPPVQQITLGDVSPELKKLENYYVANINVALSDLEFTRENKELLNNYMDQLTALNDEYQRLTKELNDLGPNEQTISALIDNLQLRLQLLYKLKQKLNEVNIVKNENSINQQI